MSKKLTINNEKRTQRAALVAQTAQLTGVSERHVRRVISGDSNNETVFSTYMTLLEETNQMLEKVREMVPFN